MPPVSELISQILLKKLRHEELSPGESATLAEWEGRSPEHAAFINMLMDEALLSDKLKAMLEPDQQPAWQKIENALEAEWEGRSVAKRRIDWRAVAVAASVLVMLGVGAYFLFFDKPAVETVQPVTVARIAPANSKATLKLSDGSIINLSGASLGPVAKDSGVNLVKEDTAKLSYESIDNFSYATRWYNELNTPKGGQYEVRLPDGTTAVLNAASSIRYPTMFGGRERRVEITGEVYFHVAKRAGHSFIVQVNNGQGKERASVEVLGTHFNIMAYDDEPAIKTSLLEGKVKIGTVGTETATLQPGQEAQISFENKLSVANADVSQAAAWKNGMFSFKNADILSIMRRVGRLYDVEVVYKGNISAERYSGQMEYRENISKMLELLEYMTGLKFSLEKGTVTVLP